MCTSGYGCIGLPCATNADCGNYEYCCGDACSYYDCSVDNVIWIIYGSISGTFFVILAISLCVYFARRRLGADHGNVTTATTIIKANPPYHGQNPPSYEEGHPYFPPPLYVQYPPYTVGSTKSCEPPPPYNGAPDERSGGVTTS